MPSIEGMWAFRSGSAAAPDTVADGGIVILESGRVFGGDSVMAYLGKYETSNGQIEAKVRSWKWNNAYGADAQNVFGMSGPIDIEVTVKGQRNGDQITGHIWPTQMPSMKLRAEMVKITDLP